MSVWHEVTDQKDVEVSEDGKTIDVLFSTDDAGNNYVTIPIEFVNHFKKGVIMPEFDKGDLCIRNGFLDIRYDLGEHETFLSFNSDDQAIAFDQWMNDKGIDAFKEWYENTYDPAK